MITITMSPDTNERGMADLGEMLIKADFSLVHEGKTNSITVSGLTPKWAAEVVGIYKRFLEQD